MPDFNKVFVVEYNTCLIEIAGVISYKHHLVAFFGDNLVDSCRWLTTFEHEFYAIYRCCQVWEPYLIHREFIVKNYHIALCQLNSTTYLNIMHSRWYGFYIKKSFSILHQTGTQNGVADALSRRNNMLAAINMEITILNELKEYYGENGEFKEIWRKLNSGLVYGDFNILGGFMFNENCLCIPVSNIQIQLIHKIHCNALGSYRGREKTIKQLESHYY